MGLFKRAARLRESTKQGSGSSKLVASLGHTSDVNDGQSDSASGDELEEPVPVESIESDIELKLHIMGSKMLWTRLVETNHGSAVSGLPTRYLPPGSLRMLYCQYSGTSSYSHFARRYRMKWCNLIRFAAPTNFPTCDDCQAYKDAFHDARDALDKYEIARQYKAHIQAVSEDRHLETFFEASDPFSSDSACLFIHTDGMDQAKFCIPRCRAGVTTKSMAKYERPRVKIQGCWLHAVLLTLHVIDVRQSGDAAMVIECLSQDLEQMYKVCREQGKQPPRRILCWVDNTVKECKNNSFLKWLCWLLLQKGNSESFWRNSSSRSGWGLRRLVSRCFEQ